VSEHAPLCAKEAMDLYCMEVGACFSHAGSGRWGRFGDLWLRTVACALVSGASAAACVLDGGRDAVAAVQPLAGVSSTAHVSGGNAQMRGRRFVLHGTQESRRLRGAVRSGDVKLLDGLAWEGTLGSACKLMW
jgi:hypothetical protein